MSQSSATDKQEELVREAYGKLRGLARIYAKLGRASSANWHMRRELAREAHAPLDWLFRWGNSKAGGRSLKGNFGIDLAGVLARLEFRRTGVELLPWDATRIFSLLPSSPAVAKRIIDEWSPRAALYLEQRGGVGNAQLISMAAPALAVDDVGLRARALEYCLSATVASRQDVRIAALEASSSMWNQLSGSQADMVARVLGRLHHGSHRRETGMASLLSSNKVHPAAWGHLAGYAECWQSSECARFLKKVASESPLAVEGILLGAVRFDGRAQVVRDIISAWAAAAEQSRMDPSVSVAVAGIERALSQIARDGGVVFGPGQFMALTKSESGTMRRMAILAASVASDKAVVMIDGQEEISKARRKGMAKG